MGGGAVLNAIRSNSQELASEPASGSARHRAVLATAGSFLKRFPWRVAGVSALVLLPCFWHRHIIASDLGSHLYNAWLAQLIQHGQAPGLWLSSQWTNVAFDWMLGGFGSAFGWMAAEKIAVSLCVLIFFWGAFALISALAGRAPWFVAPLIALFAYGWTFHIGLLNYYLAIGLSFFYLAVFSKGKLWERLAMAPVAALVAVAHPFGLIWLICACLYIGIGERLSWRYQIVLLLAAAAAIAGTHYFFSHHYVIEAEPDPFYWFNGTDQLILFGGRYRIVAWAAGIFTGVALLVDAISRRREAGLWRAYSTPVQLYVVVELAIFLFPRGVQLPHRVAIALITERLTSISAVLGCCVLGAARPAKWHLAALLAIGALFASFLYQDTATVNQIEQQAERLVKTLPPDQRVLASIAPLDDSRIMIQHTIELACIERCFSYGNYEPGSAVFRVRATPGNRYVLPDYETATDTEEGTYIVEPKDLPLYQVYQCTDSGTVLCIRPLEAGEENNRLGVYQQ